MKIKMNVQFVMQNFQNLKNLFMENQNVIIYSAFPVLKNGVKMSKIHVLFAELNLKGFLKLIFLMTKINKILFQ